MGWVLACLWLDLQPLGVESGLGRVRGKRAGPCRPSPQPVPLLSQRCRDRASTPPYVPTLTICWNRGRAQKNVTFINAHNCPAR